MGWRGETERLLGEATRAFAHEEIVVLTPAVGAPTTFNDPASPAGPRAVFSAAHERIEIGEGGIAVSTTGPALGLRLSDCAAPPLQDDAVAVGAETYRVAEVRPDGEGGAMLHLRKA